MVQQYTLQGWWVDAGKPDAIIEANQYVLSDRDFAPVPEYGQVDEKSEVSYRVDLGKGSKVIASKIRGPVVIGSNVTSKNSYVGPYSAIGDDVVVENSEIEASIMMNNCTLRDLPGRIDSSLMADYSIVTSSETRNTAAHRFVLAENSYVQL